MCVFLRILRKMYVALVRVGCIISLAPREWKERDASLGPNSQSSFRPHVCLLSVHNDEHIYNQ